MLASSFEDKALTTRPVAAGPSRLRVRLLLGIVLAAWLPGAAADEGPCARPCGRAHTCGELNVSFACDFLSSNMGCDCTGCCLASLAPLAPPAPPPPVLPPPKALMA